eukprot:TRINITY_DN663_c0_g1_i1.p1 TRINITY_DN663_c0_g1~~TRINITY_DN663_c0_g1_i1.p1  ORF type:complete len:789 (+),score=255.03 TRINITY_DN663_c0_g1_i1:58-2424(+)
MGAQEAASLTINLVLLLISVYLAHWLRAWVMSKPDNDQSRQMLKHAVSIQKGAYSFMKVMYWAIFKWAFVFVIILFCVYAILKKKTGEMSEINAGWMAMLTLIAFAAGVIGSSICGVLAIYVTVQTSIRTAAAAEENADKCLKVCFRGGAFTGMIVSFVALAGIQLFYFIGRFFCGISTGSTPTVIVGFGFGASFVSMFSQIGGSIYQKATGLSVDILSRVEKNLPEDPARNPALIASLVGSSVGDCAARAADLFESACAESIGGMFLGVQIAEITDVDPEGYVLFPLLMRGCGLAGTMLSMFLVYSRRKDFTELNLSHEFGKFTDATEESKDLSSIQLHGANPSINKSAASSSASSTASTGTIADTNTTGATDSPIYDEEDPWKSIQRGYLYCLGITSVLILITCRICLYTPRAPGAWWSFFACSAIGIALSAVFVYTTILYVAPQYAPVQHVAHAYQDGNGSVVPAMAVGMESAAYPVVINCVCQICCYWIGQKSGLTSGDDSGIYGISVMTMGVLSSVGFMTSMNCFGPIADNAGAIAELSKAPRYVRDRTDRLIAGGFICKCTTKGYAVGCFGLTASMLIHSFHADVYRYTENENVTSVEFNYPEVNIGGLLGVLLIFFFCAATIKAVELVGQVVVADARRQFQNANIVKGTEDPDVEGSVSIATRASIKAMYFPVLLILAVPIVFGVIMRGLGDATDRTFLSAQCMGAFVMCGMMAACLMAIFMHNSGAARASARKLVDMGKENPSAIFDTSGASMHVVSKFIGFILLCMYPLFISPRWVAAS